MNNGYQGVERRQFRRIEYVTPLDYKICKPEIIEKLLQGYIADISPAGLLCNIKEKVNAGDILWLSFGRDTLDICHELEKRSFIYQHGVIGKVVRISGNQHGHYQVGVKFITREEKTEIELLQDKLRA